VLEYQARIDGLSADDLIADLLTRLPAHDRATPATLQPQPPA
jgi:hypothetical protein